MSKCLVLGGSGKLGSALVKELQNNSKHTEVISHSSKDCDLTLQENTFNYIRNMNPDVIYNCAGIVGGILFNSKYNPSLLLSNSLMALNVASICNTLSKVYYYISSSCAYPKNCNQPMKEYDLFTGSIEESNKGYGLAKQVGMELCNLNPTWRSFIPCNLYHENDEFSKHGHVLPSLVRKICLANEYGLKIVEIWGDGNARREHLYTSDCARAINIATNETTEKIVNIGSGIDHSIIELAEKIKQKVGWNGRFVFNPSKPIGMARKLLDISILNRTSWKQYNSTHIDNGICLLIEGFHKQSVQQQRQMMDSDND